MMTVDDAELSEIAASRDILSIGMRADEVRCALHGLRTTFVRVADVPLAAGSAATWPPAAGEIRIAGVPESLETAVACVHEIVARAGAIAVSAFSLADLEALAVRERLTLRAVLEHLRGAGLELVAEAPFDRLQDPRRSIEEVNIAGLTLARLTVHQLPDADPLVLLKQVAAVQHDVGVLRAFAPLPRRLNPAVPTTGYDDVRRVALARLVVQNIPSIQVDWALYGPKLAQVALTVGADDLDAVSADDESPEGRRRAPLEEVRRNIIAAGQEPVERTGRFDVKTA